MAGGEVLLERLTPPVVEDFLIRGVRFIKWDEVSLMFSTLLWLGVPVGSVTFLFC